MKNRKSRRAQYIRQSPIRAMTRMCRELGGINMAQGICDLDVPQVVADGAKNAIDSGSNIYMPCEGEYGFREAVARKMKVLYGMEIDFENEVFISAGATGAFYSVCLTILDPGDQVILFEPFYGYHDSTIRMLGCTPVYSRLKTPGWDIDRKSLDSLVNESTKAIIINTPANPSGKVFSEEELLFISDFARKNDLIVITDEIYESFVYEGLRHIPPASIPGMRERTVTISGFSKIYSITGWRIGYAICPPDIFGAAAHFNDLVYVCAPSPLQIGAAEGLLNLKKDYYDRVMAKHLEKRDLFCAALNYAGMKPYIPQGSYYVLADISSLPGESSQKKVEYLLEKTGVGAVPGNAFYHDTTGDNLARFCFAKKQKELEDACEKIRMVK